MDEVTMKSSHLHLYILCIRARKTVIIIINYRHVVIVMLVPEQDGVYEVVTFRHKLYEILVLFHSYIAVDIVYLRCFQQRSVHADEY